ncbi:MAG: hypothetical protein ACYTBS_10380, partial [Planctomycetota bacterium]
AKVAAPYDWVIGVNTNGEVVHNLQDPQGGYGGITSVNEFDGWLYPRQHCGNLRGAHCSTLSQI